MQFWRIDRSSECRNPCCRYVLPNPIPRCACPLNYADKILLRSQNAHQVCAKHQEDYQRDEDGCRLKDEKSTVLVRASPWIANYVPQAFWRTSRYGIHSRMLGIMPLIAHTTTSFYNSLGALSIRKWLASRHRFTFVCFLPVRMDQYDRFVL